MEIKIRYVAQHINGHFVDIHSQPVENFMKAARFAREDDLEIWLLGRYGPDDPHNFRAATIKVTYELEGALNVQ